MEQMWVVIYTGLRARWVKAGKPQHDTELCLWDMSRVIDKVPQQSKRQRDILQEAVTLMDSWVADGKGTLDAHEKKAIEAARTLISSGWGAGRPASNNIT